MGQSLETVAAIVEELGGPTATGKIVGRSAQSAWNWRAANKLPADTFLVLQAELRERGKTAPPSLWGIVEPQGVA